MDEDILEELGLEEDQVEETTPTPAAPAAPEIDYDKIAEGVYNRQAAAEAFRAQQAKEAEPAAEWWEVGYATEKEYELDQRLKQLESSQHGQVSQFETAVRLRDEIKNEIASEYAGRLEPAEIAAIQAELNQVPAEQLGAIRERNYHRMVADAKIGEKVRTGKFQQTPDYDPAPSYSPSGPTNAHVPVSFANQYREMHRMAGLKAPTDAEIREVYKESQIG